MAADAKDNNTRTNAQSSRLESSLLSKWWRTESAQRAIQRAKDARQERFAKVRAQFQEKQETLARDVELWSDSQ